MLDPRVKELHTKLLELVWQGEASVTQWAAQKSLLYLIGLVEHLFPEMRLKHTEPVYARTTVQFECEELSKNWGLDLVPRENGQHSPWYKDAPVEETEEMVSSESEANDPGSEVVRGGSKTTQGH